MKNLLILMSFSILAYHSFSWAVSDHFMADTGQTKCFNETEIIPCPGKGNPFYGQDAQYKGKSLKFSINENSLDAGIKDDTVYDLNTSLTWERVHGDVNGDEIFDFNDLTSRQGAINYCSSLILGGIANWRLPNMLELESIIDYSLYWPVIDDMVFLGTHPGYYWTSSLNTINNETIPVVITFQIGQVYSGLNLPQNLAVRCVSGSYPSPSFIVNLNGTVLDQNTGLMWKKSFFNSFVKVAWEQALAFCEDMEFAGYKDWRLPNVRELLSLMDYTYHEPAIDPTVFQNVPVESTIFWSSTTSDHEVNYMPDVGKHPNAAWTIDFFTGKSFKLYLKTSTFNVKCVRGGDVRTRTSFYPQLHLLLDEPSSE